MSEPYQRASRAKRARSLSPVAVGQKFGALVVETALNIRRYANREMQFWRLRCECGNAVELPSRKFAGRATNLYRSCDECRQKVCVLCGERYPFARRYSFCAAPACCEWMERGSRDEKNKRTRARRADDPEYRAHVNERTREWQRRNPGYVTRWLESLTDEAREEYRLAQLENNDARMERLRNDPAAYRAHREKAREWERTSRLRRAQSELLNQARPLIEADEL